MQNLLEGKGLFNNLFDLTQGEVEKAYEGHIQKGLKGVCYIPKNKTPLTVIDGSDIILLFGDGKLQMYTERIPDSIVNPMNKSERKEFLRKVFEAIESLEEDKLVFNFTDTNSYKEFCVWRLSDYVKSIANAHVPADNIL